MVYPLLPPYFRKFKDRKELATSLGVTERALDYVKLVNRGICRRNECPYPAVQRNYGFCCLHSQTWFPSGDQRGSLLLGDSFMRKDDERHAVCVCTNANCKRIGYTKSLVTVPGSPSHVRHDAIFGLNITDKELKNELLSGKRQFEVAYWHFHPEHRVFDPNKNMWQVTTGIRRYKDAEGKVWHDFPPVNYKLQNFLEEVNDHLSLPRNRWLKDSFPAWVKSYCACEEPEPTIPESISPKQGKAFKGRAVNLHKRNRELEDENMALRDDKMTMIEEIRQLKRALEKASNEKERHEECINEANEKIRCMQGRLLSIVQQPQGFLSFDDLKPGGRLGGFVGVYTYFDTYESNNLFLEMLNWTDRSEGSREPGDGLCENMRRYRTVPFDERQGKADPRDAPAPTRGGQQRKLDWKTEWLVYNVYCHCGWTQEQVAPLFGLKSPTLVGDIIYAWANFLADSLATMFPPPTRSQLLRAYPLRMLTTFGHALIMLLLDATEVYTQDPEPLDVHAALRSDYKDRETEKILCGCDPIGCSWDEAISDGFPGAITDATEAEISAILNTVPFGMAVETDKGILVDIDCWLRGIWLVRPQKKLKLQTQQSVHDTGCTQKVGNSRIVVEQLNGQAKMSTRYFNGTIPILQLGLAPLILRVAIMLQNFKLAFIQGADSPDTCDHLRPSRAEIRWYGGTDDGLIDIRDHPELWATETEKKRIQELKAEYECAGKRISDTEIAEIVLAEDWPSKQRHELSRKLESG